MPSTALCHLSARETVYSNLVLSPPVAFQNFRTAHSLKHGRSSLRIEDIHPKYFVVNNCTLGEDVSTSKIIQCRFLVNGILLPRLPRHDFKAGSGQKEEVFGASSSSCHIWQHTKWLDIPDLNCNCTFACPLGMSCC